MKNLKIIFCMAFAIGFSAMASAQTATGKIMGSVIDSVSRETIPGAVVFIEYGGSNITATTDIDGKFKLSALKPGSYNLHIKTMEAEKVLTGIRVNPDQITFQKNIELNTMNVMEDVVISEPRVDLINPEEASRLNLSYAQIKDSPNLRQPDKLIEGLGGGITRDSEGQLYFRGARPNSTVTFVDGVKTGSTINPLPGRAIGNITVYTGGIPAKYGDVTGGVIIMETKSYFDLYYERLAKE